MTKHLTFPLLLLCFLVGNSQDSTYYNVFWTPDEIYRKAGITQEGVFQHYYKSDLASDSVLYMVKVYDSLGRIIRYQYYKDNRLNTRMIYYYSGGQLDSIQNEYIWIPAKTVSRYKYNENGTIALISVFDTTGKNTINYRRTYNELKQPFKLFTQTGNEKEYLSAQYKYRSDHLVDRIDYFFDKNSSTENFSYIYVYEDGGKRTFRLIDRKSTRQPITDIVRLYNRESQLIKRLKPYVSKLESNYNGLHLSTDDIEEQFHYFPNGMLSEIQTIKNGHVIQIERHFYK